MYHYNRCIPTIIPYPLLKQAAKYHALRVSLTGRTLSRSEVVRGRAHRATRGEHVSVEGGRPGATRQGVGLSVDTRETSRRLRGPAAPPTGARRRGIQHGEDKARDGRTGGRRSYLRAYRWGQIIFSDVQVGADRI